MGSKPREEGGVTISDRVQVAGTAFVSGMEILCTLERTSDFMLQPEGEGTDQLCHQQL